MRTFPHARARSLRCSAFKGRRRDPPRRRRHGLQYDEWRRQELSRHRARPLVREGLKVAPFKAQNMSNNARVIAEGEMGSAQYFHALAARCVPDVRMNPVLLKPETDTRSQVILLGQRDDRLSAMEWRQRSEHLWPTIHQ
jgi:adenosylcobyric acid synthase